MSFEKNYLIQVCFSISFMASNIVFLCPAVNLLLIVYGTPTILGWPGTGIFHFLFHILSFGAIPLLLALPLEFVICRYSSGVRSMSPVQVNKVKACEWWIMNYLTTMKSCEMFLFNIKLPILIFSRPKESMIVSTLLISFSSPWYTGLAIPEDIIEKMVKQVVTNLKCVP